MTQINNQIMLITYADSLGRNLQELDTALLTHFQGAVGGIHILPFYPSSADRGFAPLCYDQVDPAFGSWEDIHALAARYDLMFDFMINHISRQSACYQDMVSRGKDSPYWDMFLHVAEFWPRGEPTYEELALIYKRKPRAPFIEETLADGRAEKLWCTFSEEQVDLDVRARVTRDFIRDTISSLAAHRMKLLRLDAFAYAVKKPGTSCFFVEPDIWHLLEEVQAISSAHGVVLLPEIHEHYTIQLKLAKRGYWVYDFALPFLLLYTLYTGDTYPLVHWLKICPRRQFTTLDTHDGIGVVDVKDLLSDGQIEDTREMLYQRGANVSRVYSSAEYNNLDIYQINCTYYSALGDDDQAYLLARAIQFFAPGIPQVYYVGMLAGRNDLRLVEHTRQGRDINRHPYSLPEISQELKRPVVQQLLALMRFRNQCPAFHGDLHIHQLGGDQLQLVREHQGVAARLTAHCRSHRFLIEHREAGQPWQRVAL